MIHVEYDKKFSGNWWHYKIDVPNLRELAEFVNDLFQDMKLYQDIIVVKIYEDD